MDDGRMKVRLKVLPDEPRGIAWPSSARGVNCPVKSGNERDPYLYLLISSPDEMHSRGTARVKWEEEVGDVGQYGPKSMCYTRHTMAGTMGCNFERRS